MKLFKCQTVEQFKIGQWLVAQGITADDIAPVELLARDRIKVTAPWGAYMILVYSNGEVTIDQTPEP